MFTPFPREAIERTIHDRFATTAARVPDRVAVRFRGVDVTYAGLRRASLGVAARLGAARARAGPGAVAVLLPQGASLVAGILGVLEAGDWYVPLDPAIPAAALRDALARAEAVAVLADAATVPLAAAAAPVGCAVVPVNGTDGDAADVPPAAVSPDALAYVYFTSGTTGVPKGVMDSHRNVLHNVMRYTNTLRFSDDDRMTLLQGGTFSGAVSSMFGALLNGATLLPWDVAADGVGPPLARWIAAERPTVLHAVPALFRSVCFEGAHFPSVRLVRLEGDAAAPGDVERLRRHFDPVCMLVNGLGTTETGICRQFFVRPGDAAPATVLPVGHAVEDMEVRVVDAAGHALPPGAAGEIVVRSRHLAAGYWRDPGGTARAFRAVRDAPGLRDYRTGDLGRLDHDGCLEHLGRVGDEVRIQGRWVDVHAVEAALAARHDVREAAVAALPDDDGGRALAAWVVPAGPPPTFGALRRALVETLPAHMVPSRAFALPSLPLGPNGKLDRRALATTPAVPLPQEHVYVAPRDAVEETLAAIWREVLGAARPGVEDAFTDLGGDSLAAAAVAFEIERRFGIALPLTTLLGAGTIADLARAIAATSAGPGTASLIPVRPSGTVPPLFCVHDLESNPFLFARLAHHLGPAQPVHALRFRAASRAAIPADLGALAERYIADLRTVAPAGPYRLAGFCYGAVVALEMAHRLRAAGDEVSLLALINVTAFDFPTLVTPAAQRRFRLDWGARLRYVAAKPGAAAWLVRRAAHTIGNAVWRVRARLGAVPDAAAPPPAGLVQAALFDAFRRHRSRPWPGHAVLFPARESLALYADDAGAAWSPIARAVEIHVLPRDGYAMLSEPDVALLAAHLKPHLEAVDTHDPAPVAARAG